MSEEAITIKTTPDSELAAAMKAAATADEPIFVDTGDGMYSLTATNDPPPGLHHPLSADEIRLSQEGILKAAGSWKNFVDAEAFKAYLKERRRASGR